MISNIYSIRDNKGSFGSPMIANNDAVASRAFAYQVMNDQFYQFSPKDFDFYRVGTFDLDKGVVTPIVPIELVYSGESAVNHYGKTE